MNQHYLFAVDVTPSPDNTIPIAILVFGLLAIALQIWVLISRGKGWGPISTRMCGVTLVIVAALFIVTAPVARENVATVIGLLGTIAGYILGKSDKTDQSWLVAERSL